jgi:hypothetical protein
MKNIARRMGVLSGRLLVWLVFALAAAGILNTGPAVAAPPSLLTQNLLAQQGLAVGLLHTTVQAELAIGFGQHTTIGSCVPMPQGGDGSLKTLARTNGGNNFTVELYYDNACANLYLNAVVAAVGSNPNVIRFSERLTYYGVTGARIGTVRVSQRLSDSPQGVHYSQLSDVATFTPVRSGLPMHFGLYCSEPAGKPSKALSLCGVGVAQTVPMLSQDVASITPINVKLTQITGASYQAEFGNNTSQLARGTVLGISAPTTHSLAITGTATNVGHSTATGSIGLLSPFLGAPVTWTITDTAHNAKFAIALHDGATPLFVGSIAQLDNSAKIATIRVDIAGNGFVLFSNNQKIKVSNWMMVN